MASLGNPKVWVPYMDNKDCSQGFCSFYCPQWCYVIYPPPPPPFEFPKDNSTPNFSPLVIAIIGIFASAFLLVTYYTLISKYCGNRQSSSQSQPTLHEANIIALEENQNPSLHHEPWHVSNTGLDEALIKSITVCKYKKGDGLVELTDCSVCLSEFQDGESVRLLPKCNHAFHLPCIDTWLKSHSSCPLCRASIFTFNAATTTTTTTSVSANLPVVEIPSRNEVSSENQHFDNHVDHDELDDGVEEVEKTELRTFSDLGNLRGRHGVIEIREIQRSVSMDHCFESGLLIADVLNMNEEENEIDSHVEVEGCSSSEVGSSKRSRGESSKSSYRRKVMHCVLSPISMKRSFSSGRIGRGRQGILPV